MTRGSKEGADHVDDTIFGIHNRQYAPFVKCQTRVRYIEGDHIADTQIVPRANLHVRMLIHHSRERPAGRCRLGHSNTRPVVQRWYWKPGIESCIALTHTDDRLVVLRYRLHVGPDL